MEEMKDWQKRVVDEKNELEGKLKRLLEFQTTEAFNLLPPAEIKRLGRQAKLMDMYCEVLNERIANFS